MVIYIAYGFKCFRCRVTTLFRLSVTIDFTFERKGFVTIRIFEPRLILIVEYHGVMISFVVLTVI
jgi:hypothetical protein